MEEDIIPLPFRIKSTIAKLHVLKTGPHNVRIQHILKERTLNNEITPNTKTSDPSPFKTKIRYFKKSLKTSTNRTIRHKFRCMKNQII